MKEGVEREIDASGNAGLRVRVPGYIQEEGGGSTELEVLVPS